MTKMKKNVMMIVSVCLIAFAVLMNISAAKAATDYNGYSEDDLKSNSQNFITALVALKDSDMQTYMNSDDATTAQVVTDWAGIKDELGSFKEFGDFSASESKDSISAVQTCKFEKCNATITFVYNADDMSVSAITIDKVYSLGERLEKAALNTVMGMGTVFIVLIMISLIIYCLGYVPKLVDKLSKKEVPADAAASDHVVEQIQIREEQLQDDLELVAVISAAIAAATGSSTDDFIVRSIKRR